MGKKEWEYDFIEERQDDMHFFSRELKEETFLCGYLVRIRRRL